ncbi:hypothetical protein FUT69_10420 [Xylella taiwanensis]|uniref:Uncharacterized protein n=1 Tax=Xylella taiwanensis TaxID=1444770 RepID=Z9JHN0_9GAMM|nr:hypothetical protein [Xylella taiwanensis]AXI82816.1 hypothetical protein AB672_02015 [Xylella taiwanensis]EWS77326.1 hypothetical protein AF72_11555 [Xylella taiwanensis]MCD8455828.1 hypothetical protein [Xylella taiwanensis]MCD8458233.1 hypothetical protein [Xylella taiwanensis]MCD8460370.1 hypothetical protein [Xylella taiwanensis]
MTEAINVCVVCITSVLCGVIFKFDSLMVVEIIQHHAVVSETLRFRHYQIIVQFLATITNTASGCFALF